MPAVAKLRRLWPVRGRQELKISSALSSPLTAARARPLLEGEKQHITVVISCFLTQVKKFITPLILYPELKNGTVMGSPKVTENCITDFPSLLLLNRKT